MVFVVAYFVCSALVLCMLRDIQRFVDASVFVFLCCAVSTLGLLSSPGSTDLDRRGLVVLVLVFAAMAAAYSLVERRKMVLLLVRLLFFCVTIEIARLLRHEGTVVASLYFITDLSAFVFCI
jgi:Zn-dependent protease with chaperone function